jgi:hypothetical protein
MLDVHLLDNLKKNSNLICVSFVLAGFYRALDKMTRTFGSVIHKNWITAVRTGFIDRLIP